MCAQIHLTTATGLGPLPALLEAAAGPQAVARVFAEEGVPLAVLDNRSLRLPLASMIGIFERAARISDQPRLGLEVGLAMMPREYGLFARYALQAPTLGVAIARLTRSLPAHQVGGSLTLAPRAPGEVAWLYDQAAVPGPGARQHNDHVLPVMLRVVRSYCGPGFTPLRIEAAGPLPDDAAERETLLGTPWQAGPVGCGFVLPTAALRTARPAPLGEMAVISGAEMRASVQARQAERTSDRIAALIALRLLDGHTDIDGAARMAGVGRRTLQRLLDREQASYRALIDRVRLTRARALVVETDMPLFEIAHMAGYSDHAHLTRAFQRYFNVSPSALRATEAAARPLEGAGTP